MQNKDFTNYVDPLSGIPLGRIYDETEGLAMSAFDPTRMIGDTELYKPILDQFAKDYKEVLGVDVEYNKTAFRKTYDLDKDQKANNNYHYIKKQAMQLARQSDFGVNTPVREQEQFSADWASEIMGMMDYLSSYIPDKNTIEGKELTKRYNNLMNNVFTGFYAPGIQKQAELLENTHSINNRGNPLKRTIGQTAEMFGAGLQAKSRSIAQMLMTPKMTGFDLSTDLDNVNWSAYTEELAQDIFNMGQSLEGWGGKQLEGLAPPTGKYAESFVEKLGKDGIKAWLDIDYGATKLLENFGSQMLTTVPTVGLSTIAQLSYPGIGLVARTGLGLISSTPGLAVGNILETGDAYKSAKDHLELMRRRAKGEKNSTDPNTFEENFNVVVNDNVTKTADQLTDGEIMAIAKELGLAYGWMSTGIEALGSAGQAGVMVRALANKMGIELGKDVVQKEVGKHTAQSMWQNIMEHPVSRGVTTTGANFLSEGLTEGLQQYTQESLLSQRLPMKDFETESIYDAMYAGAISGATFSGATQAGVGVYAKRKQKQVEEAFQNIIDERKIAKASAQNYDDPMTDVIRVMGAAGIPQRAIGNYIAEDYDQGDKKAVRLEVKSRYGNMKNEIMEIRKDKPRLIALLKNNRKSIETIMPFTERNLQALELQPSQIAEFLGVQVSDLKQQEGFQYKKVQQEKNEALEEQPPLSQEPVTPDPTRDDPTMDDPTLDEPDMDDPTQFLDPTLEGTTEAQIANIESEKESLQRGSRNTHLSPEDRQAKIDELDEQKANLQGSPTANKQIITNLTTPKMTKSSLSRMKKAKLQEIATDNNIELQQNGKDKTIKMLVKDIMEQVEPPAQQTIEENARETATGITVLGNLSSFGGGIKAQESYTPELLIDMESADPGFIVRLAQREGIDSEGRTQSDIISDIVQKFPPQMNMGIPLTISQKARYHREFKRMWINATQNVKGAEIQENFFRKWAFEKIMPLLPEGQQKVFEEWAVNFNPQNTNLNPVDRMFDIVFKNNESDRRILDDQPINDEDYLKEATYQAKNLNADIHAENYTHLNSSFFEGLGVTLSKDMLEQIETSAVKNDNFNDFVTEISKDEYSLLSQDGMTPADIVNQEAPLKRKLYQYWVSSRAENNIKINQGERVNGETAKEKAVFIEMIDTKDGWGLVVKGADPNSKRRMPKNARATMADRFVDTPIVWLNGADLKGWSFIKGKGMRLKSKYGFLNSVGRDDQKVLKTMINKLIEADYVPLFVRGDSDRLALIKMTDTVNLMNPEEYWAEELANNPENESLKKIAKDYMEPSTAFGNEKKTQLANIQRHIAFKDMLGKDYHEIPAAELMQRIKILYTPAMTFTGGKETTFKVLDTTKALEGKETFQAITYLRDGTKVVKDLVKTMNGILQYTGDGMSLTSERVFRVKYPSEVGANPDAYRAKTIKAYVGEEGTTLHKHQEMTVDLPNNATKMDIVLGGEKVAEVRLDKGERNIFVKDDKTGEFTQYVDHLNTNDESKIRLGEFANYDKIHTIPSQATGHIMFTEGDKRQIPFPMQLTNYINDKEFLNAVNDLMENKDLATSTIRVLQSMVNISQNPEAFDTFLQQTKSKYPDALPRMIMEMANMGAGLHDTQLAFGKTVVKTRLFQNAMDNKVDGGVLDFRPSYSRNIEKGNVVLPYSSTNMMENIARKLEQKIDMDMTQIMRLSVSEINDLLKKHEIKISLVRHPIPSRAGYRMLRVTEVATNIGDSFMINDEDVKEVFEGDFDHDTGHIGFLPPELEAQMERMQDFDSTPTNLDQYSSMVSQPRLGSLDETLELMEEMSAGQTAIGEIANIQRMMGIGQANFGSMEILGKTVKLRDLNSQITDPKVGTMSVEELLKHYAQAAFDNVSKRLLKTWDYSQDNLIKKMFYNSDGTEINDVQAQILRKTYLAVIKKTQSIRNAQQFGEGLDLDQLISESQEYKNFTDDRAGYLREMIKDMQVTADDGVTLEVESAVGAIEMKGDIHPHEKLAIMPIQVMDNAKRYDWSTKKLIVDENGNPVKGMSPSELFNFETPRTKMAHDIAYNSMIDQNQRLTQLQDLLGVNFDNYTPEQLTEILDEWESGEQWGAFMRQNMMEVYAGIENDSDGQPTEKIANSMSWDYNIDFVEFTQNWLNGFTMDNNQYQKGYNELTETEKIAATYQFLEGIKDTRDGMNKYTTRKIPPISNRPSESLLHPTIMEQYFKKYNKAVTDLTIDPSDYQVSSTNTIFQREMKEFFNCE